MKRQPALVCVFCFFLLLAGRAKAASADDEVIQGKGVGSLRLGDPAAKVIGLGFQSEKGLTHEMLRKGRVQVRLLQKKVSFIEVVAPAQGCFIIKGMAPCSVKKETRLSLASRIGPCAPLREAAEGGNSMSCAKGLSISFGGYGGRQPLTLTVRSEEGKKGKLLCHAWVDHLRGEVVVKSGQTYCWGMSTLAPFDVVVTSDTAPDDLLKQLSSVGKKTCKVDRRRGGTHLVCGGVTYSFAGPHEKLHHLTVPR